MIVLVLPDNRDDDLPLFKVGSGEASEAEVEVATEPHFVQLVEDHVGLCWNLTVLDPPDAPCVWIIRVLTISAGAPSGSPHIA